MDPILPPARLAAMKAAGYWRDRTILDFLHCCIAAGQERIAVVDHNSMTGEHSALSYAELGRRVERITAGLARRGVGRGDVVSFQLPNWWQFTALHLAALRLGAVSNPLMPIFREHELGFMLRLAETKLVVVPLVFRGFEHGAMVAALRPSLPALKDVLVVGGEGAAAFERLLDEPADAPQFRPAPDDVVLLMYTSGTTGEPKGVMHTSNTLIAGIAPYVARFGLGADDVMLMASPMAHLTGFMYGLMMPLFMGGKAVLQDLWNTARAADNIAAEGVTFSMGATPFLADLADEAARRPDAVRTLRGFLSAGAPIPRALVRRATEHLGANIISAWGMTENGAVTTTKIGDPPEKTFGTDGCALEGMEIRVVDLNGEKLPPDQEGRLQARGAFNFVGYLKRPEWYATDADGWFETGDLARIDADGYVRITGRSKDVIIRGGENIPVVEVEGLIYQHPAVTECAVVAMPDPRLGERVCAFVTLREGQRLTLAELSAFLQAKGLARPYFPERLEVLADLPKTPSGKIQKNVLRGIAKEFAAMA